MICFYARPLAPEKNLLKMDSGIISMNFSYSFRIRFSVVNCYTLKTGNPYFLRTKKLASPA